MERLHKFLQLSPGQRRLLIRTWLLLLAVRLGLWVIPFRSLRQFWRCFTRIKADVTPQAGAVDRIAWAVSLAGRYVPRATCLTQALAMQILLKREGIAVQLHLGVAKDEQGRVTAHAWLEQDGRVLIGGGSLESYIMFDNLERLYEA